MRRIVCLKSALRQYAGHGSEQVGIDEAEAVRVQCLTWGSPTSKGLAAWPPSAEPGLVRVTSPCRLPSVTWKGEANRLRGDHIHLAGSAPCACIWDAERLKSLKVRPPESCSVCRGPRFPGRPKCPKISAPPKNRVLKG
jgi:hypothetical protein